MTLPYRACKRRLHCCRRSKCEMRDRWHPADHDNTSVCPQSADRQTIDFWTLTQSDVTELKWHGLAFDEMTNGQEVMHYCTHRLTASVEYVTTLTWATRQPITNELVLFAHWSICQKLNRVSSVQFSYVGPHAPQCTKNRFFTVHRALFTT